MSKVIVVWDALKSWVLSFSKWQWGVVASLMLCAAMLAGVILSVAFVPANLSQKVQNKIASMTYKAPVRGDSVDYSWKKFETAYLTLERTEVSLGEVDGSATGGGIDYFKDTLVYAAANGLIGFLDLEAQTLEYSEVRVPMDYETVRRDYFQGKAAFNQNWYRVTDILVSPIEDTNRAYLYAAHHRFTPDDMNMCLYVSRTEIEHTGSGVNFVSDSWEDVVRLNACLNMEEREWDFAGHMTGGRMALVDKDNMLVSVGTYGVGNFDREWDLIQADSGNDLGKIVSVDLNTKETEIYATGFRNPQGLAFDANGRLWEAEHGAQSGDEVNIVSSGKNYGWPNVSYGFDYGSPRAPFELNPEQGRHEGYAKAAFSFVPAIGVSNLVPMTARDGFELWDGDVLALSLKQKAIFRLRPEGDRIVYAEPMDMGSRMRDGLFLENGWIAVLTGDNSVIFIRTTEENETVAKTMTFSGYDAIKPLEKKAADFEREFSWGQMLFTGKCASCHEIDNTVRAGPGLQGLMSRKIGEGSDYSYSEALAAKSGRWNAKKLGAFLADPEAFAEGSYMPLVGMDKYEREAIVEYIMGL